MEIVSQYANRTLFLIVGIAHKSRAKACASGRIHKTPGSFLLGLMLYVHGQQLRSCRDGQLSYPHYSWASLLEAGNQYLAHIILPLTDNCSS